MAARCTFRLSFRTTQRQRPLWSDRAAGSLPTFAGWAGRNRPAGTEICTRIINRQRKGWESHTLPCSHRGSAATMAAAESGGLACCCPHLRTRRAALKVEHHLRAIGCLCRAFSKNTRRERGMLTIDMKISRAVPGRTSAPPPRRRAAGRAGNAGHGMVRPRFATSVAVKPHDGRSRSRDRAETSRMAWRASRGVSKPMTPQSS